MRRTETMSVRLKKLLEAANRGDSEHVLPQINRIGIQGRKGARSSQLYKRADKTSLESECYPTSGLAAKGASAAADPDVRGNLACV